MKKNLLLLGTLMLSSLSAMAQSFTAVWPKAEAPAATEFEAETEFYLYNVGAGGFYIAHQGSLEAPYWGTRASVNDTIGALVKFTRTNPDVAIEETWDEALDNTYLLTSFVPKFKEFRCTFAGGTGAQCVIGDIWTDNNTRGDRYFNITKVGDYYKIDRNTVMMQNSSIVGKDSEGKYIGVLGSDLDRVLYLHDTEMYLNEKDEEYYQIDPSAEFFEDWIVVSPDAYEAWMATDNPTIGKKHLAALRLKAALEKAYEENPGINLDGLLAVYNNTNSSFDELVIAKGQIQEVVNEYKSSFASFDDPIDFSEAIGSTASSFDPWVRTFTGSGTTGDTAWNTWSVEADNGGDGTDMVTPFRQVWVASGGKLSDQKIHQTLAGAAPGLYKFTVDARVYSEAGKLDAFEGAYLYFGDEKVDMQEQVAISYSGSKSVLWTKNYFTIIAIVKEGGDIDFGFEIKDANFNWISWKNVSLKYYGNENVEENALKLYKAAYTYDKVDEEETLANPTVIKAYNDAVDAFNAASTEEGIKEAAANADAAWTTLTENVSIHVAFYEKIATWTQAYIDATDNGMSGDEMDAFGDFINNEDDVDGYPTPSVGFITSTMATKADQYPFLTKEVADEYILKVDELWQEVLTNSAVEGVDMTSLLINADFKMKNLTGWTGSNLSVGGLEEFPSVERYGGPLAISQTVKGAPAGIYSIKVYAFYRPAANGEYNGTEEVPVYLYMNKMRTPVQHIMGDALPVEEKQDQVNCYLTSTTKPWFCTGAEGGFGLFDYETSAGLVPNGMCGASVAFSAGRYEQTVYGMVNDGEDMTVGLTSDGKSIHWCLFSNFKLTFEGKNPEAVNAVLNVKQEELRTFLDNENNVITTACRNTCEAAYTQAEEAHENEMWDALNAVLDALNDAQANKAALEALTPAIDDMNNAAVDIISIDGGAETEAYKKYADEVQPKTDEDAIAALDTEGLESLTEEVKAMTEELQAAVKAIQDAELQELAKQLVDEATLTGEPVDMTSMIIVNPSFDTDTEGWNLNYASGTYSNLRRETASYTNDKGTTEDTEDDVTISQFVNAWRNAAKLGDGDVSQVTGALPAGAYALEGDFIASWQSDASVEVEGAYFFVQIGDQEFKASLFTANEKPEHYVVRFKKELDETSVKFGFRTENTNANWISMDNLKLSTYGNDWPTAIAGLQTEATSLRNRKVFENGRIVIYKNGQKYNVAGQAIK